MASSSDINTDHPNPGALAHTSPKCINCVHFATVPAFRAGGAPATCGSPLIQRDPQANPCIRFAFDTMAFTRLPEHVQEAIFDLIEDVEDHGDNPYYALIGALIEAHKMRRRKLRLGGNYRFESGGDRMVGRLISLSRSTARLKVGKTFYTVPIEQITLVSNRDMKKKALAAV